MASPRRRFLLLLPALFAAAAAQGQPLAGHALVSALRSGGYVIVMRHASSPNAAPAAAQADPDNVKHERQLDAAGRSAARAMGSALHHLHIPVGQVLSSPTYRALETVRIAQLGRPKSVAQLGDSGHNMQVDPTGRRAQWLRKLVTMRPPAGTDTFVVTQSPNMTQAFPHDTAGLSAGEALIFHPDGHDGAPMVARVKIDAWTRLAAAR